VDLDQLALLTERAAERADARPREAEDTLTEALERAGRYLSRRPRTERQVRSKLEQQGYDSLTVNAAVDRLIELRLVDDADFARRWVEERATTKGRAPDVLVAELEARGVSRELAEEAITSVGLDEETQAVEVAGRLQRKVVRYPLGEQGPRLYELLRRRGFEHEAAEAGARAALPPEGWD
jgi:regulatory protein